MSSSLPRQDTARVSLLELSGIQKDPSYYAQYKECGAKSQIPKRSTINISPTQQSEEKQESENNPMMAFNLGKHLAGLTEEQPVEKIAKGDPNYQIFDLTYTLIIQEMNIIIILFLFVVLVGLRYYTMGCLIFVIIKTPKNWQWIIVILASRFLYFILVLKISLKNAQTKTQIILKTHWNSRQDRGIHELFEVIDTRKLMVSIGRALVPSELSFIYISSRSKKKRIEIFAVINYIYASIQSIIYYPFFIIYCALIDPDNQYALNIVDPNFTIFLASAGETILLAISLYLFLVGIKRKYGSFYCCGFQEDKMIFITSLS